MHLLASAALVIAALVVIRIVSNRVIRRRLLFSAAVAVAAAVVHAAGFARPDSWLFGVHGWRLEQLALIVAAANGAVALLFNPWLKDGESDRAPAIVQDVVVAAIGLTSAAVLFDVSSFSFLTGSAIVAAIVGFALQDTLGNTFAGIAIQIERPFRVGHWIAVGDSAGLVTEVTWRATKIRTKAGNMVSVPNSVMSSHVITNYSEPAAPTRLSVEVGAAYDVPPNDVRAAVLSAIQQAAFVLPSPASEVVLAEFGSSAIVYRALFWVQDFTRDEIAKSAVRTCIYYEFRRRGIEIPWPIQVEYAREEPKEDSGARRTRSAQAIAGVPVLARLPAEAHSALAQSSRELLFADGETIVREGAPGESMFVVLAGRVVVSLGLERREVAVTEAGGYFGEMSLLTGEPRTATVVARGDCTLLEIGAEVFRTFVQAQPEVIDQLALAATARRRELDGARAAGVTVAAPAASSLRDRMREFFGV